MDKLKKERLQKKGWKVGDVDEFLGLSPAEMAIVEMKVALAKALVARKRASLVTPKWNMRTPAFPLN